MAAAPEGDGGCRTRQLTNQRRKRRTRTRATPTSTTVTLHMGHLSMPHLSCSALPCCCVFPSFSRADSANNIDAAWFSFTTAAGFFREVFVSRPAIAKSCASSIAAANPPPFDGALIGRPRPFPIYSSCFSSPASEQKYLLDATGLQNANSDRKTSTDALYLGSALTSRSLASSPFSHLLCLTPPLSHTTSSPSSPSSSDPRQPPSFNTPHLDWPGDSDHSIPKPL